MKPNLEQLEDRTCPSAVTYHGGNVWDANGILASPQIVNVYLGSTYNMDGFSHFLVSSYTEAKLLPFGIQAGSVQGSYHFADPGPLSNESLSAWLTATVKSGALPAPTPDTLYMVYLGHEITDVPGAGAYHSYGLNPFSYSLNSAIPYSVCWNADTSNASHEFAEATTDPFLDGWYAGSQPADANGGEIADLARTGSLLGGFIVANVQLPAILPGQPPVDLYSRLFATVELYLDVALYQLAPSESLFAHIQGNPMLLTTWGEWAYAAGELFLLNQES